MTYDEFMKLLEKLGKMRVFWKYNDVLDLLCKVEKYDALKYVTFFNYGYMMGVRTERAKRAKRKAHN